MKQIILLFLFSLLCLGCAGTTSKDPDKINEALVGFTVNVQASRWEEALQFVTPNEVKEISNSNAIFKEEYQTAARRLPLSALKRMEWTVDGRGRLIGIKEAMDESNRRYLVSEDQKLVGTDLDQKREERIRKRLEEGRRIKENEEVQPEPEVEVFTNKLTEEEKRKYGSTGELRAPEAYLEQESEPESSNDEFETEEE